MSEDESLFTNGVAKTLGHLPGETPITEKGLAGMLGCHQITIKRAVQRGELPPPTRLCGQPLWTARAVIAHIEERLASAARQADLIAKVEEREVTRGNGRST